MNCTNCGKSITSNARFCDGCGSPIVNEQTNTYVATQEVPASNEVQVNKVIFILAYLGILFFLPLVSYPNSKIGRFHANQGLLLLIASIMGQIAVGILSSIVLAISWRLLVLTSLLSWALAIAIFALAIIGMINANNSVQKQLPIIGKFTIIK